MTNWYQNFIIDGKPTSTHPYMTEAYFKRLLPLFPPNLQGKKILDIGCNTGLVSFELAKLGAKVTGIDKVQENIANANYVMDKLSLPHVDFLTSNIETFPLEQSSFDIIVALSVLYHLRRPRLFVKRICSLPVHLVTSFRLKKYDQYVEMITSYGKKLEKEASYARKKAASFS